MSAMYGFHSENIFWKKSYIKILQFQTNILFCYFIKKLLLRRVHKCVKKGCNLLNPYLLKVLLSILFNKLPCCGGGGAGGMPTGCSIPPCAPSTPPIGGNIPGDVAAGSLCHTYGLNWLN